MNTGSDNGIKLVFVHRAVITYVILSQSLDVPFHTTTLLTLQVFVNFARQQLGEEAGEGAYDNPVDTSDEVPMKCVKASDAAEKV